MGDDGRQKGLHNDDSTLCIIEPDGSMDFHIEQEDDITSLIEKEVAQAENNNITTSTSESSTMVVLSNESKKADSSNFPSNQEITLKRHSLEEEKQRLKNDIEEFASNRCESIIGNAKRTNLYPAKKKKQATRATSIGTTEIRNFCKELVDKCKECIDKSFRMLIEE